MSKKKEVIHTKIWKETPEPDNPFAAAVCECAGFDVYGDLLGKISWIEYLYLLFKLEPPTKEQAKLFEGIAVAIANPGPRDLSVRAAMNGGVGGSLSASCLMAALGPGAGAFGGGHEVTSFMALWDKGERDLEKWREAVTAHLNAEVVEVWPETTHIPGFDPYGASCTSVVLQTLKYLADISVGGSLVWLEANRLKLEGVAASPLNMVGVAAATFIDLGFNADQAEMLFLLLRLPGAAAHALEQKEHGWRKYPFFGDGLTLTDDPGPVAE